MKLLYIAGPLAAPTMLEVRRHIEAARDLGLEVARCGVFPVIPHTNTGELFGHLDETWWLDGYLELLRRCDGILLLPTWSTSKGAIAEYEAARMLGKRIFYSSDPAWRTQVMAWALPQGVEA